VLERIINKKPSAGLWKGQTDEKELGFTYQEADPILSLHFDKHYSWKKIVGMGLDKRLVERIKKRLELNKFKYEIPRVAIS
jgi:NAD+ synthase